ncbi:MAG TPA: CYTH domain-containing protein, partial [Pseudonocardiaceae bacterium]|nr:CYTH domain-containing protein [Pseudonocardiaceae bacterium]
MGRFSEIERKFDADAGTALPDLCTVDRVAAVTEPIETRLEATYFDTRDLRLAAHRSTLRCRLGGADEGWHLKLPAGGEQRTELRLPLDAADRAPRTVPEELVKEVRGLIRGHELIPVAVLHTTRLERRLLDADGNDLAHVADDAVHAARLGAGSADLSGWREVEVELAGGDQELLEAVSAALEAAGLTRSPAASKLARTLGELVPEQAVRPKLTPRSRAAQVVVAHLREQVDELISHDPGARADKPDAVHKMRVATRRLRSALATYRPLLDRARTDPI